tara:strand:- start:735 stop:968 length:234 start_codon:yes stop_codon:yes gene_type:complete
VVKGEEEVKLKLHRVLRGPYLTEDDDGCSNLCLVEYDDGTMGEEEIVLEDFDSAYRMVKHFDKSIDPIVLNYSWDMN